jgi:hypothetical protein
MKYLFVIYTDIEYKQHLDNFKSQEFYRKICDDPTIEVIEWGTDFHTDYRDLPTKTQEMMKWCSENKEYDYLIKCDDTIFDDKWVHYRDRLVYENIFKNDDIEYSWVWGDWLKDFRLTLPLLSSLFTDQELFYKCIMIAKDFEKNGYEIFGNANWNELKFYSPNKCWKVGMWGGWFKRERVSDHYRGINYLPMFNTDIWKIYFKEHYDEDKIDYDLDFIDSTIQFYEGKFYMVSRDFSIFIGEQEKLAKDLSNNFPVEDLMVGYLSNEFKSIRSISK